MSANRLENAVWVGVGIASLWLLYLLGPILTPFVLAAILAYICNPAVDRLDKYLPRVAGVLIVMLLLVGVLILMGLLLLPLLRDEALLIMDRLPALAGLFNDQWMPWLEQHLHVKLKIQLSPIEIKRLVTSNWDNVQAVIEKILSSAAVGGRVILQILATLLLTPVAMFYLLRDWNTLLQKSENAIPRRWHEQSMEMLRDINSVLSEFLRGQILVMLVLAAYYAVGLALADVDYALPLGVLTGLLVFIPYVGYSLGLVLALLASFLQLQGWPPVIGVIIVFGVGQVLESFVLTPRLVGHRIGLHPLVVIFALMAFGQIFGFFGILVALPVSAAMLVGLRRMRTSYLTSRFYSDMP